MRVPAYRCLRHASRRRPIGYDRQDLENAAALPEGWHYTDAGLRWALVTRHGDARNVYLWIDQEPYPAIADLRQLFCLTPTQARVTQMLLTRRTNAEIAALLGISIHTVRRHVEAVLLRLGVSSRWDVETSVYEAMVRHVDDPVDRRTLVPGTRIRPPPHVSIGGNEGRSDAHE